MAVEPVLLLGVSLLQYLDGMPDRWAVDMLHYHAGWNFALNRQLGDKHFHPTTLVNFRQRLVEHQKSAVAFQTILEGLLEAGLISRQQRQRLDSRQIFGQVSWMSPLECVRESLRLTLREVAEIPDLSRPESSPIWVWPARRRSVERKGAAPPLIFDPPHPPWTRLVGLKGRSQSETENWLPYPPWAPVPPARPASSSAPQTPAEKPTAIHQNRYLTNREPRERGGA